MAERTREEAKAEIVAALTKHVDSMEKSLNSWGGVVLTNTPYIVMVGDIAIDPVIVDNKVIAGSTRHGLPNEVRRFSRRIAEDIAANAINGNGIRGVAVPWIQATENKLKAFKEQLEIIQKM